MQVCMLRLLVCCSDVPSVMLAGGTRDSDFWRSVLIDGRTWRGSVPRCPALMD